jgi:hypothetical protein
MKKFIFGVVASLMTLNANATLINIYDTDTYLYSVAKSQSIIASAAAPSATVDSDYIFYSDSGISGSSIFPDSYNTTFVLTATGFIDTSLYSALQFFHDDGITVSVAGTNLYTFDANTALTSSSWLTLSDTGLQAFDLLFWENQGYATLKVLAQLRDGTGTELAKIATASVSIPEPSTLFIFSLGLLSLAYARRKA